MSQYATFEHYHGKPEEDEQKHNPYKPIEFKSLQAKIDSLKEHPLMAVLIYASWCGPCKTFKPLFYEYCQNNLSNVNKCYFAQEDYDLNLTPKEVLKGVPSIVIYRNSKIQHVITGGNLSELDNFLNQPRR